MLTLVYPVGPPSFIRTVPSDWILIYHPFLCKEYQRKVKTYPNEPSWPLERFENL